MERKIKNWPESSDQTRNRSASDALSKVDSIIFKKDVTYSYSQWTQYKDHFFYSCRLYSYTPRIYGVRLLLRYLSLRCSSPFFPLLKTSLSFFNSPLFLPILTAPPPPASHKNTHTTPLNWLEEKPTHYVVAQCQHGTCSRSQSDRLSQDQLLRTCF